MKFYVWPQILSFANLIANSILKYENFNFKIQIYINTFWLLNFKLKRKPVYWNVHCLHINNFKYIVGYFQESVQYYLVMIML